MLGGPHRATSRSLAFHLSLLLAAGATTAHAQLAYQQKMDHYSAILPLTLDNDVIRVRCKPPEGLAPRDINCDIGITGTVLTDQRGTSSSDPGQKVLSALKTYDNIDVQFADRVYTGYHNLVGDRIVEKYDLDCGINVKYENKLKVAQLEVRVGYILPSGDREGLTWAKLSRKRRILAQDINKCERCQNDIEDLNAQRANLQSALAENTVQRMHVMAGLRGVALKIDRAEKYASRRGEFERDLAAFTSLEEYLKTKVNGCQVFVHFHHNGETLPVDVEDLKRSRLRPIQIFEVGKDPAIQTAGE